MTLESVFNKGVNGNKDKWGFAFSMSQQTEAAFKVQDNNNRYYSNQITQLKQQTQKIGPLEQKTNNISEQLKQQAALIVQMQAANADLLKKFAVLVNSNAQLKVTVEKVRAQNEMLRKELNVVKNERALEKVQYNENFDQLKTRMNTVEYSLMTRAEDSSAPPSKFPSEEETDSSEESNDTDAELTKLADSLCN